MPMNPAELHAKAVSLREQADRQMDATAAAACRAMADAYEAMAGNPKASFRSRDFLDLGA